MANISLVNDFEKIKNLIKKTFGERDDNFMENNYTMGDMLNMEVQMFIDKLFRLDTIAGMLYTIGDIAIVIDYKTTEDDVPYLSVRKGDKTALIQCKESGGNLYDIMVGDDIYCAIGKDNVLGILALTIF